ncbi:MAG: hypothetical protein H0X24_01415 [Ktedonobacterales bacterium]|nr:hypothetical protein [Ktedonobacterales bacterium]
MSRSQTPVMQVASVPITQQQRTARSLQRLLLSTLSVTALAIAACSFFGEQAAPYPLAVVPFAWTALLLYLAGLLVAGGLHLRWWWVKRHLFRQQLAILTEAQQARLRVRQVAGYLAISLAWLVVTALGFSLTLLFDDAQRPDVRTSLYEIGGWVAFTMFVLTGCLLVTLGVAVVEGGFTALAKAASLHGTAAGDHHRRSWMASMLWLLLVGTAFPLYGVQFGWWTPSPPLFVAVLVIYCIAIISGTALGWWYDWRSN